MSLNTSSNAILCAGRLYCDLVFTGVPNMPVQGTETFSDNLSLHAGGGAFITAAAFSAQGWDTSLLATLPAAPFDEIIRRDIARFDLDARHCATAAVGTAPQLTVAISGQQDRAFLSHKTGKALPEIKLVSGMFRHLHIGELRSLVEHPYLIEEARNAGMTLSVDCGWDQELLNQGAEMAGILAMIDVFLPNETEYDHLTKSGLPEGITPLIVIKCGADGAKALERGKWVVEPAARANVVDTTGAGDAFNGGFLSAWLADKSLRDSLLQGNRCGCVSVERAGGTGGLEDLQRERVALGGICI